MRLVLLSRDRHNVEASPGRFLIIDNDDLHTDRQEISKAVIGNDKKGNLDSVKFLLKHSIFDSPDFKINGEYS